ncbi:MAG: hypothetical protein KDK41_14060 [Leptospiraceae bacterium]|nr:hypothetical protein [Leptospiraceae bacterium]
MMTRSLALLFFLVFSFPLHSTLAPSDPDFQINQDTPIIKLNDIPWNFYWQKLLTPKDVNEPADLTPIQIETATIWNKIKGSEGFFPSFGYATYSSEIKIISDFPELAIRIPAPLSSSKVFINGRQIAATGQVAEKKDLSVPQRVSILAFFPNDSEKYHIIVQVTNFTINKGGLRGTIEIGEAQTLLKKSYFYSGLDLFAIGIIFTVSLFHFAIYILGRRDKAYLYFSLLSFIYFLMAFFMGEQSIILIMPEVPLTWHARIASFSAYCLSPMILLFISNLYPDSVNKNVYRFFTVVSIVFMFGLLAPVVYITRWNIFYYAGVGISVALVSIASTIKAFSKGFSGSLLLIAGLLCLLALTGYSIYLYQNDKLAGSYLSVGFALFALFQASAIAQKHSRIEKHNNELLVRLQNNRKQLEDQRKKIERDLHDNLGGSLTDLKLGLSKLRENNQVTSLPNDKIISYLQKTVDSSILAMRNQILFIEDLNLMMQDFIAGINLILLRRYQNAGIELELTISHQTRDMVQAFEESHKFNESIKLELCSILQEITTNNLKYGKGKAEWTIQAVQKYIFISLQSEVSDQKTFSGFGRSNLEHRIRKIGGSLDEKFSGTMYNLKIVFPIDFG